MNARQLLKSVCDWFQPRCEKSRRTARLEVESLEERLVMSARIDGDLLRISTDAAPEYSVKVVQSGPNITVSEKVGAPGAVSWSSLAPLALGHEHR